MRYRTLSSVIKILDSDIISSSATGFVVRGARALRAGDRVAAAGRFYKVVGVAIVTGNTSISATNPVLSEIFAEFEVTGGMDLANSSGQGAAALFSGDSAKATTALKDVVFSISIEIKPGVTFDGKVTIPKMELIFNAPYSALGSSKPSPSAGVVMTIRGSAELEGALTVDAIGKVFFPPSAEAESAFGYQSRPGCFDVWTGGTLLMGASLPICLEAQVDAGFKTTTRSIKKITNFELIATRSASGAISWTQTFSPVDTATLGPPVDLPDSESFFTTTISLYVAPRVVLTSFLGSLNLLSFTENGLGVGLDLGHHRRVGVLGHAPQHLVHLGLHLVEGDVDALVEVEGDGDDGHPGRGGGLDVLDPGHAVDRGLHQVGDRGVDDVRVGAALGGRDRDHRELDVGQLVDPDARVGDQAEQDQHRVRHEGEHMAFDR